MFSFRKRPRANSASSVGPLKTSLSLPTLSAQGIPWPESLVDVSALHDPPPVPELPGPYKGAVKSSLPSLDHAPIPFHKPFRLQPGQTSDTPNAKPTKISSLYMLPHPPSAFENYRPSSAGTATRRTQRRNRTSPAFNLMVVGARGTGKTSLLRLLLDTADISPSATGDQVAALQRFVKADLKHTQTIDTACVEICESRYDRVLLTVIDTPGLDFSVGQELNVERQVTQLIKYIDEQYAATMNEESKVVRQSRGDQHVHLCIFMIDPSSILNRSTPHGPPKSVSESTVSMSPTAAGADQLDKDPRNTMMSPAEFGVIHRLSARVNVLPVIAKADSLTDETLSAVKTAVRKGLRQAGLDFGVLSSTKTKEEPISQSPPRDEAINGSHNGVNDTTDHDEQNGDSPDVTEDDIGEERSSRTVIRLRGTRTSRSRSRPRRDLSSIALDEREPQYPDENEDESVSNVRFSAKAVTKVNLDNLLPFALITPEPLGSPRHKQPRPKTAESCHSSTQPEDLEKLESPIAPRKSVNRYTPPESLRGVFTRKFRWGTVDVLNPEHCDFAALRTAILLTHMKVLKAHTREVLYEKYRTEKLLAKRATRTIGPEETKRLFEDLGL